MKIRATTETQNRPLGKPEPPQSWRPPMRIYLTLITALTLAACDVPFVPLI